jgi:uncharacterized protein
VEVGDSDTLMTASLVSGELIQYGSNFFMSRRTFLGETTLLMRDPDNPDIKLEVHEAATPLERARGLLGATEVGEGQALLLRGRQVHTIGMSFPIDVVHLRSDGRILKVKTINPGRLGPMVVRGRWVLELDAGAAGRLGLRPGGYLVRES